MGHDFQLIILMDFLCFFFLYTFTNPSLWWLIVYDHFKIFVLESIEKKTHDEQIMSEKRVSYGP